MVTTDKAVCSSSSSTDLVVVSVSRSFIALDCPRSPHPLLLVAPAAVGHVQAQIRLDTRQRLDTRKTEEEL
jgi:hypothetical protein